jgi:hypothetical protein
MEISQAGIPAELLGPRSVRMRNWDGGVSAARLVLERFACVVGMLVGLRLLIAMLVSPVWALAGTDYETTIGRPSGGTEYVQVRFPLAGRQVEKRLRLTAFEYASLYAAANPGPRPAAERTVHVRVLSLGAWYSAHPIASPGQAWDRVIERWFKGLIVNGLLWLAVNAFWVKPWRVRSLYRYGRPVPGLITAKRKEQGSVPFSLVLDFVFLTPDNQQHQGTVKVAEKAWEQARKGESITVLHPEWRTEPSVIYQYGPYRCE